MSKTEINNLSKFLSLYQIDDTNKQSKENTEPHVRTYTLKPLNLSMKV